MVTVPKIGTHFLKWCFNFLLISILQRSNDESSGNFVISSLGPQLLLSLINKETRSETQKEIKDVIGNDGNKRLGKLIKLMTSEDSDRELQVATAMFVNADYASR